MTDKIICSNCFWNKLRGKSNNIKCIFSHQFYLISTEYKKCRYCSNVVPLKKSKCPFCWRWNDFKEATPISQEKIDELNECKSFIKARTHREIIENLKEKKDDLLSLEGKERRKRVCFLSECRPSQEIIKRLKESKPFLKKIKNEWGLTANEIEMLFPKIKEIIIQFQKQRFKQFAIINRRIFIACCFYISLKEIGIEITQFEITRIFGISSQQLRDNIGIFKQTKVL
jgi:hypothetical protein